MAEIKKPISFGNLAAYTGEMKKRYAEKADLSGYVQKEEGKGLSANDFTDEAKEKLDAIPKKIVTEDNIEEILDTIYEGITIPEIEALLEQI